MRNFTLAASSEWCSAATMPQGAPLTADHRSQADSTGKQQGDPCEHKYIIQTVKIVANWQSAASMHSHAARSVVS
jgi:hypothetical protein